MQLPQGAYLEEFGGGYLILNLAGEEIGAIGEAWALDANNQKVPVHYSVEGTTLLMHVRHIGATYPVVADPSLYSSSMNTKEKWYCAQPWNMLNCSRAKNAADKAFANTNKAFPNQPHHNNAADAFRHCNWSGLMTFTMGGVLAKTFGDMHEDYPGNPEKEKKMDLHNNARGREYGGVYRHLNSRESDLYNACIRGTRNGDLRIRP